MTDSPAHLVASAPHSFVPSLLHVYWVLHAIHLVLGGIVLRSWWRGLSVPRPQASVVWTLAPWLGLALLFWIPGIYLEWPSDPWEHLRRVNEWHIHNTVIAHSAWKKSSYFLSYSLTGHAAGLAQLSWLNCYYTGVCLLLSWQYYRLARAVGLGTRASFIFILINALTCGNNVFSFYSYYGLSSSIFAQLGAVALSQIALKYFGHSQRKILAAPSDASVPISLTRSRHMDRTLLPRAGIAAVCLIALIIFNHVQGLGIAALGLFAVGVWRLIEWKRGMIAWLAVAAFLLSAATVLWFPRHSAVDAIYRPQGWLTAWYGFNVFSSESLAFARAFQVLGAFGILNLVAGIWLLRRNHVAGWLTFMPVLALLLPCFAVPLAHTLAAQSNIITFQRFLFAVPAGLALAVICSHVRSVNMHTASRTPVGNRHLPIAVLRLHSLTALAGQGLCVALLPVLLFFAVTIPPDKAGYNRFWQSIQVAPADLQLTHHSVAWTSIYQALSSDDHTLSVYSPLGIRVSEAFIPGAFGERFRQTPLPIIARELEQELNNIDLLLPLVRSDPSLQQRNTNQKEPLRDWNISPLVPSQTKNSSTTQNLSTAATPWVTLAGYTLESAALEGALTISNSSGAYTQAFNPDFIAIDASKRYRLSSILRQSGDAGAVSYLAVAWYDRDKRFLPSNQVGPEGAGRPAGWTNGYYSYYGLLNGPAPSHWTCYSISFGLGELTAIPRNAAFLRVGALLNYNAVPEVKIQLGDVTLQEKDAHLRAAFVLPATGHLYSPYSITARLSGHWLPQKAAEDHFGLDELRAAMAAGQSKADRKAGR